MQLMHKFYTTKYVTIVGELLTIDCGYVYRWSRVTRTCKLGTLEIFSFLQVPATSFIKPTNDGPILRYL